MTTAAISLSIDNSIPAIPLGFEVWVDNKQYFNCDHVKEPTAISFEIAEDNNAHKLILVLKNKLPEHTKIDKAGNIVDDAVITVSAMCFDGIEFTSVIGDLSTYQHNFNSTGATTTQPFHGIMGCNGTATIEFSTPIYLWLLENM
jgi:hypothetical protein